MTRSSTFLALAVVLGSSTLVSAQRANCPDDPFISPQTDPCNPLRYIPDKTVNIVAAVLYFAVAIVLTWQHWRHRANYMLCLVIGAYCEAIGLVLRVVLRNNVHSQGLYIAMYLFVVLSPCAFLAGDCILLGRLVAHLGGNRYLRPLKPNLVSWTFIISDVITFLIQAAGGGLSISKDINQAKAGGRIFLAGIAAQMASFIFFTGMWAVFAYRVRFQDQLLWQRPGWKPLHWALGFTCVMFLIRSVYRTVKLSEGYIGYLATHEVYFLTLDTLPLFLGISVYMYFWPGKYLTPETKVDITDPSQESVEMGEGGMEGGNGVAREGLVVPFEDTTGSRTPGSVDTGKIEEKP